MLEHLRQVIGLRGCGQRDPLNEYKAEAFSLFEAMIGHLREAVTAQLMRVEVMQQPPEEAGQELPFMEAHHLNPHTGEDELALAPLAPANASSFLSNRRPSQAVRIRWDDGVRPSLTIPSRSDGEPPL